MSDLEQAIRNALADMTSDHIWLDEAVDAVAAVVRDASAEAWDEGLAMSGPLGFRAFSDLNPYRTAEGETT